METAPPEEVKAEDELPPVPAREVSSDPMPPGPTPLEPTLSELIMVSYEGGRDDAGRYDTTVPSEDDASGPPGPAKAAFIGGHKYTGAFLAGMMHGQGKYEWADGTTYEGEFKWNVVDGKGKFVWPDGSTYEGDIKKGMRHGMGTFVGPGGAPCYSGEWNEGARHGQGTLWYDSEKDCFYEGGWRSNERHGEGRMRYKPKPVAVTSLTAGRPRKKTGAKPAEGNLYVGGWADDQKNGKGTMEWFDKREKYIGDWADDKQHGHGVQVWMDDRPEGPSLGTQKMMCNRYDGKWKSGARHGMGTFYYANGAKYQGEWLENAKEGYGVFTFEDGHVYEGPFANDRMTEEDTESPLLGDSTLQPQLRLKIGDLLPAADNAEIAEGSIAVAPHGGADQQQQQQQQQQRTGGLGSAGTAPQAATLMKDRLEKTVLRYTSELKIIYKRYSAMVDVPGAPASGSDSFALTMGQFKKLYSDCNLGSYGVSLSHAYRLAAAMRTQHASEIEKAKLARAGEKAEKARGAVVVTTSAPESLTTYDPEEPLLFREFVELLARIAMAAFGDAAPKLTPSEAFKQLMVQAISPNHSKTIVKDSYEYMLDSDETKRVFATHENRLRGAFESIASRDGRLTLRSFLKFLSHAGAATPPAAGGLGLGHVDILKKLVVGSDETLLAEDPTLLDMTQLWTDFLEAFAILAREFKPGDMPEVVKAADGGGVEGESGESDGAAAIAGSDKADGSEAIPPGGDGADIVSDEAADTVALDAYGPKPNQLHQHLSALFDRLDLEGARDRAEAERGQAPAPGGPDKSIPSRPPRLPIALS